MCIKTIEPSKFLQPKLFIEQNTPTLKKTSSSKGFHTNSNNQHGQKKVVSASHDGFIRIWDLQNGRPVIVLSGHTNAVHGLEIDNFTKTLISSSLDETVRLWDISSLFTPSEEVRKSSNKNFCKHTIQTKGSTGVTVVDSIIICGGIDSICLYSISSFNLLRELPFDKSGHGYFDPSVIINKIVIHETGIALDYGEKLKIFHFAETVSHDKKRS